MDPDSLSATQTFGRGGGEAINPKFGGYRDYPVNPQLDWPISSKNHRAWLTQSCDNFARKLWMFPHEESRKKPEVISKPVDVKNFHFSMAIKEFRMFYTEKLGKTFLRKLRRGRVGNFSTRVKSIENREKLWNLFFLFFFFSPHNDKNTREKGGGEEKKESWKNFLLSAPFQIFFRKKTHNLLSRSTHLPQTRVKQGQAISKSRVQKKKTTVYFFNENSIYTLRANWISPSSSEKKKRVSFFVLQKNLFVKTWIRNVVKELSSFSLKNIRYR